MSTQANLLLTQSKEEVRQYLREVTEQQTTRFLQAAQAFYDQERRSEEQCLKLLNSMIDTLNNVIAAGDWDSSFFLKTTIKPLRKLLGEAEEMKSELLRDKGLEAMTEYVLQADEQKCFVSLYQADGHDLERWALQLSSIDKYTMGRPIYRNENDVVRAIRRKLLQTSEAYAVIVVKKQLILGDMFSDEKTDRHGFSLVTVEQGVIKSTNVVEFVHGGKRYHYHNQRLIEKT